MPLINVKLTENVFTPDQKREIVEEVARADQAATCGRPSCSVRPADTGGRDKIHFRVRSSPQSHALLSSDGASPSPTVANGG